MKAGERVNELTENLNSLWTGIIKRINFDLLKHSIVLELEIIENTKVFNYELIFEEVSSYFFLNNEGNNRIEIYPYEEGDYLELTAIHYIKEGIGDIVIKSQQEEWTRNLYASANFVLEIWSSYLFIEAKSVLVNGKKFYVATEDIFYRVKKQE